MPIYSYSCIECNIKEDRNVKIDDRHNQHCNGCGVRLVKEITRPGLVWAPTAGGYRWEDQKL